MTLDKEDIKYIKESIQDNCRTCGDHLEWETKTLYEQVKKLDEENLELREALRDAIFNIERIKIVKNKTNECDNGNGNSYNIELDWTDEVKSSLELVDPVKVNYTKTMNYLFINKPCCVVKYDPDGM